MRFGVSDGVELGVSVGVGVLENSGVGVEVAVEVGVAVGVSVRVGVGVGVGVGTWRSSCIRLSAYPSFIAVIYSRSVSQPVGSSLRSQEVISVMVFEGSDIVSRTSHCTGSFPGPYSRRAAPNLLVASIRAYISRGFSITTASSRGDPNSSNGRESVSRQRLFSSII